MNFQYSNSSNISRFDKLSEITSDGNLKYAQWYYGPQKRLLSSIKLNLAGGKIYDSASLIASFQKINESRIQKSVREKKYAQSILKKQQEAQKEQQELLESQIKKDKEKSVFKRWSSDARSKFSVITLKRENGNKAIKLPSTPESK